MAFIKIREDEDIETALRRFKRQCERDGILKDLRRRAYYTPPSIQRQREIQERGRRLRKLRKKRDRRR